MFKVSLFGRSLCAISDQCGPFADKRCLSTKIAQTGVSLLEVLIVIALLAGAVAVVLPNLHQYQQEQHRKQGESALRDLAQALHEFKAQTGTYAGVAGSSAEPKNQGSPWIFPTEVPGGGAETYYRLRVNHANKLGFELRAVPVGRQTSDPCGTLTLTSGGVRGMLNAQVGALRAQCWFEPE